MEQRTGLLGRDGGKKYRSQGLERQKKNRKGIKISLIRQKMCGAVLSSPITSESCSAFHPLAVSSCVPLLFPAYAGLKQQLLVTELDKVEPPVLILDFLIWSWDKRHAVSSIPVVSSPIPDNTQFFFFQICFGLV